MPIDKPAESVNSEIGCAFSRLVEFDEHEIALLISRRVVYVYSAVVSLVLHQAVSCCVRFFSSSKLVGEWKFVFGGL